MEIPEGKLVTASGLGRDSVLSETISFLRFPLILLVVTIHVQVEEYTLGGTLENFPIANFFCALTRDGIAKIAVPLFFFISGYLFFLNVSHSSAVGGVSRRALHSHGRGAEPVRQEQAQGREHGSFPCSLYFKKLKKRFWTLFVPIAVWGIPVFIAKCIAWKLSPGLFQLVNYEYSSVAEFVQGLFTRGIFGFAIGPFWFIRSLIIACILSPLWFFLLKKLKVFPLIIFGVWYCFFSNSPSLLPAYDFGVVVFFFFCFGAYFSIHEIDFTKVFRKIRIPVFIIYPILLVGDAVLCLLGYTELYGRIKYFEIIIGLVATIALVSGFLEKRPTLSVPKTLRDATFFVFAGHTLVLSFGHKLATLFPSLFPCETNTGIILAFIVGTVVATGVFVLVSILVRKFAPWSIRFLTGGR